MKTASCLLLATLVALTIAALCSCGGLYGPNPQPPASEVSDRQPVCFGDGYEPGMHECHE